MEADHKQDLADAIVLEGWSHGCSPKLEGPISRLQWMQRQVEELT